MASNPIGTLLQQLFQVPLFPVRESHQLVAPLQLPQPANGVAEGLQPLIGLHELTDRLVGVADAVPQHQQVVLVLLDALPFPPLGIERLARHLEAMRRQEVSHRTG